MTPWETAPISSVHLWFDRPIMDQTHAVFLERTCQWIFNGTMLNSSTGKREKPNNGYYYQVVISNSKQLKRIAADEIVLTVLSELADVWPVVTATKLIHSRFITSQKSGGLPAARSGKKASSTADISGKSATRRRLDENRLAFHDGKCRQKRLSRCGEHPSSSGQTRKNCSTRVKKSILSRILFGI